MTFRAHDRRPRAKLYSASIPRDHGPAPRRAIKCMTQSACSVQIRSRSHGGPKIELLGRNYSPREAALVFGNGYDLERDNACWPRPGLGVSVKQVTQLARFRVGLWMRVCRN